MTKALPVLCLMAHCAMGAAPLKVDVSQSGRNDTAARRFIEWQVPADHANTNFGGVHVTVAAERPGQTLGSAFYKGLLDTGGRLGCDGVYAEGGLTLTFSGLAPGDHTIATYHNSTWNSKTTLPPFDIYVSGERMLTGIVPSIRAPTDDAVTSAFVRIRAEPNASVVVKFVPASTNLTGPIVLNGFELDSNDPGRKAKDPWPADDDEHVDGSTGSVRLSWRPAPNAVHHDLYFGTNAAAVESANRESPVYIGRIRTDLHIANNPLSRPAGNLSSSQEEKERERGPSPTGKESAAGPVRSGHGEPLRPYHDVRDLNQFATYYWRVDEVDESGAVTQGDLWEFRIRHLAFPSAEGYGRFARGGRGGRVIAVTNLNDSGPGSLRAAVEAEGPRTVVFHVSGLITLESKLVIKKPYLTIAGQTAPGKGICIRKYNLGLSGTHDVIVRFLRVRPGNIAGVTLDGMGMQGSSHSILDHCSISWSIDEAFSSRSARHITLQRTLISEALNAAGHKKYPPDTQHGYAASISGFIGSFHHNLLAHCAGRNWSLAGGLNHSGRHTGWLDIRNNVVYNWKHRTTDGGAAKVNFVNNYYKPGPATRYFHVLNPERKNISGFGPQNYYVAGNVMEGHYGADQRLAGVTQPEPYQNFIVDTPFFESFVRTHSAEETYQNVLADVGCNRPQLDDHDRRVIQEVRTGTFTYRGSKTGLPGLPDSQQDVGGWEDYPEIRRPADWDTDGDGMPNDWERRTGLNPDNVSDGIDDRDLDGYTNLEEYLGWLAGEFPGPAPKEDKN